jgi:hypothetical protein
MEARMAITTMTINISTSVNPWRLRRNLLSMVHSSYTPAYLHEGLNPWLYYTAR